MGVDLFYFQLFYLINSNQKQLVPIYFLLRFFEKKSMKKILSCFFYCRRYDYLFLNLKNALHFRKKKKIRGVNKRGQIQVVLDNFRRVDDLKIKIDRQYTHLQKLQDSRFQQVQLTQYRLSDLALRSEDIEMLNIAPRWLTLAAGERERRPFCRITSRELERDRCR